MFLGPACSKAALPVAESIHYWNVVQASLMILLKELCTYYCIKKKNKDGVRERERERKTQVKEKNYLSDKLFDFS